MKSKIAILVSLSLSALIAVIPAAAHHGFAAFGGGDSHHQGHGHRVVLGQPALPSETRRDG